MTAYKNLVALFSINVSDSRVQLLQFHTVVFCEISVGRLYTF